MVTEQQELLLHLNAIPAIGPATVAALLQHTMLTADLYKTSAYAIQERTGLSLRLAQTIVDGLANKKLLEYELACVERASCSVTTLVDQTYPSLLREIHLPPPVLYVRGAQLTTIMAPTLAVVGSRAADDYAADVLRRLIPPLVARGIVVVSGGAYGADTIAHRMTLNAGGRTVAVLGSGLLCPYPRANADLFAEIVARGGAVISPFPLTMQPVAGNFPARNRIIAGLSNGCLVVQAAERSGALITAQFALEQGREVFAIPGPLGHPLSVGCHRLIQQGAQLVNTVEDIFVAMAPVLQAGPSQGSVVGEGYVC